MYFTWSSTSVRHFSPVISSLTPLNRIISLNQPFYVCKLPIFSIDLRNDALMLSAHTHIQSWVFSTWLNRVTWIGCKIKRTNSMSQLILCSLLSTTNWCMIDLVCCLSFTLLCRFALSLVKLTFTRTIVSHCLVFACSLSFSLRQEKSLPFILLVFSTCTRWPPHATCKLINLPWMNWVESEFNY